MAELGFDEDKWNSGEKKEKTQEISMENFFNKEDKSKTLGEK